ncbi:protein FilA [Acinetobacter sp. 187]|uniref:Protein FilA n=1 Tax=Acinetobacter lanii TaxID=2715163 RepID=A0A6G8S676_9GAMM|nr:DUF6160 family protein [Acinetobacter lanii]NHC04691.1 protein FilA [Acinetobacter lanii]QIO09675.1 protein FilA [Acinetobacter lanii]
MKLFTKVALVSSIAVSANAMAMQAMDDASLSSTTGQDGINIGIKLDGGAITVDQLFIHDNDGLADTALGGTSKAGAIVLGNEATKGISITQTDTTKNLVDLVIDSDAGTADKGGAFLNVAANVTGMKIAVGPIGVAASGTTNGVVRGTTGTVNEILTGLNVELGSVAANVQLGATPQGAMINLNSEITGGLKLTNLGIKDNAGGGSIVLDSIQVVETGKTSLGANAKIGVTTDGLYIKPAAQNISAYVGGVHLGSAAAKSIGDIEIKGLNMGGSTISITGH